MSHEFYLAMSYAAAALAVVAEIIALRVRSARALRRIDEERDLETTD